MSRYTRVRRYGWAAAKNNDPTTVTIHWSQKSSAFAIKFQDTKHWNEMQIALAYIKNFPYGERDYDPENKIWFLVEQHVPGLKTILENLPQYFSVDFIDKPTGGTNHGTFVPIDTWIEKFTSLTGQVIKGIEYGEAKRVYRKWQLKNHPDVGGDPRVASAVNECWSQLELNLYKKRKEPEYVS